MRRGQEAKFKAPWCSQCGQELRRGPKQRTCKTCHAANETLRKERLKAELESYRAAKRASSSTPSRRTA